MPDDDDNQMWKPPDAAKAVTVGQMFTLANNLRKHAYWYQALNEAVQDSVMEAFIGLADDLDKLFGFKSDLSTDDRRP